MSQTLSFSQVFSRALARDSEFGYNVMVEKKIFTTYSRFTEFKKVRGYKYVVSVIVIAVATVLQVALYPVIQPAPYLLYYPAVIIASLYGDGRAAIVLSVVIAHYLFVNNHSFDVEIPNDIVRMSMFILSALMIRNITHSLALSKLRAETAVEDLRVERETREKFVTTLAHDLQTPLTTIKLQGQMMLKRFPDQEALTPFLSRIMSNVKRVELMIRNLLDANSIKAGQKLPITLSELELNDVVHSTLNELSNIHGERFFQDDVDRIHGTFSEDGIQRMVENLCTNAVKYGSVGSIVTVTVKREHKCAAIMVHNLGSPISEEDQRNLFEPFRRLEVAEKSGQKGWGLGLALVKALAEAHNGSVQVLSDASRGTTFVVKLPIT